MLDLMPIMESKPEASTQRPLTPPTPPAQLTPQVVLGIMSGTSLDGMDAVVAQISPTNHNPTNLNPVDHSSDKSSSSFATAKAPLPSMMHPQTTRIQAKVVARWSRPYTPELTDALTAVVLYPERANVIQLTQLHAKLGQAYAVLVEEVVESLAHSHPHITIDSVALSGQTVYHIPSVDVTRQWHTKSTLQLGEASIVCEHTGLPVYADFRQSDMAAGGQGAPLVAFADFQLFSHPHKNIAVHNLGGISNLTYLPALSTLCDTEASAALGVLAFDTGPANCLIDEAMGRYYSLPYDKDGRVAAQGEVQEDVLEAWLTHPYFAAPPPKTTGREMFNLAALQAADKHHNHGYKLWQRLEEKVSDKGNDKGNDKGSDKGRDKSRDKSRDQDKANMIATLTALTAHSIAQAYRTHVLPLGVDEIIVAGGGAANTTLMQQLRNLLAPVPVNALATWGYDIKDREALAFAVLGYFAYHGRVNTLPQTTGARHGVVAGKCCQPSPMYVPKLTTP